MVGKTIASVEQKVDYGGEPQILIVRFTDGSAIRVFGKSDRDGECWLDIGEPDPGESYPLNSPSRLP